MIRGGFVTFFVSDSDRAVRFYVETLGMKLVEEESHWAVIDAGDGLRLGLAVKGPDSVAVKRDALLASVSFYPKVPFDEAIAILENRGVHFDVKEIGPMTFAHFRDPDGNALALCTRHVERP